MIFAKFDTTLLGLFWIEIDLADNRQGEERAKGIAQGYSLLGTDRFEMVDIRLSKHPTEPLRTWTQIVEMFQSSRGQ